MAGRIGFVPLPEFGGNAALMKMNCAGILTTARVLCYDKRNRN